MAGSAMTLSNTDTSQQLKDRSQRSGQIIPLQNIDLDHITDEEDRALVRMVVDAVLACKYPVEAFRDVRVTTNASHYLVEARPPESCHFEMTTVDLDVIESVSPFRIASVAVCFEEDRGPSLRVRVLNKTQRLEIKEGSFIRIQKRRRVI